MAFAPYASCAPYGYATQCSLPAGCQPFRVGVIYPLGIDYMFHFLSLVSHALVSWRDLRSNFPPRWWAPRQPTVCPPGRRPAAPDRRVSQLRAPPSADPGTSPRPRESRAVVPAAAPVSPAVRRRDSPHGVTPARRPPSPPIPCRRDSHSRSARLSAGAQLIGRPALIHHAPAQSLRGPLRHAAKSTPAPISGEVYGAMRAISPLRKKLAPPRSCPPDVLRPAHCHWHTARVMG